MTRGRTIIGIHHGGSARGSESEIRQDAIAVTDDHVGAAGYPDGIVPSDPEDAFTVGAIEDGVAGSKVGVWDALVAAGLLIAALIWAWGRSGTAAPPAVAAVAGLLDRAAIPAMAALLLWLVWRQSPMVAARSQRRSTRRLVQDMTGISERSAAIHAHLSQARASLTAQAAAFERAGLDATARLADQARLLATQVQAAEAASARIAASGDASQRQVDALVQALPRIEDGIGRMADRVRETGLDAHRHGAMLEEAIAALMQRADDAASTARHATADFAIAADGCDERATGLLARLADVADASRAQVAAIQAEQAARLDALGLSVAELRSGLTDTVALSADLQTRLERGAISTGALQDRLDGPVAAVLASSTQAVDDLADRVERLTTSSATAGARSDEARAAAEGLLGALDAVARESDVTLPAALARLTDHGSAARAALDELGPVLARHELIAASTLGQARDATASTRSAADELERMLAGTTRLVSEQRRTIEALSAEIASCADVARRFSDASAPMLVSSLMQVRETANHAASRSRDAFAAVITQSAEALRQASGDALEAPFRAEIDRELARLSTAADAAVERADAAADRLSARIAELDAVVVASLERADTAARAVAGSEQDRLAHRMTRLVDALRSRAIDITRAIAADVPDTLFEAYLKGDRSVFARRAVRLLDAPTMRDLSRQYHDDANLRAEVDAYVADYEAMLRGILGTRDGDALAVTLLSSDVGKLYVALAQAIDRLKR